MDHISLNTGSYSSAFAGMRPELPTRRSAASESQIGAPLDGAGALQQAPQFDNVLGAFVKEVNAKQLSATDQVNGVLSGQNVPLHQAMIAMEEASVSFSLMLEVRNKLLEGYQELMRMQI